MSTVRVYQHQIEPLRRVNNTTDNSKFLEKQKQSQKKQKVSSLISNSFLTVLALFLILQFARGTYLNVERYLTLNSKMANLKQLNVQAHYQNDVLKKKYNSYNSPEGLEGLARDYLNLVGENEISIILKKS